MAQNVQRIGPYVLLTAIGRGHTGTVYEATDERTGAIVALKVYTIEDAPLDDAEADHRLLRFVREAEAISRLNHPSIVQIRDAGADGHLVYIAMERLHGETLRQRLARSGPMPVAQAATIGAQVADALESAHASGIIHRDVKPDNLYLLDDGSIKVMDFGAAHIEGEDALTRTGNVIGSPAYMAPEQVSGDESDRRTDIWGLAATLYESVTGARLFPSESVGATMYAILHRRPDLSLVPSPALANVLAQALARRPNLRHATAAALAADLRAVAAGLPVRGAEPRARRVPALMIAVGLTLFAIPLALIAIPQRTPSSRGEPLTLPAPPPAPTLAARRPAPKPTAAIVERTPPPTPPPRVRRAAAATVRRQTAPGPKPMPVKAVTAVRKQRPPVTARVQEVRLDASTSPDRMALAEYHPAPRLPASFRDFDGSVRVRVHVGDDGSIKRIDLVESSGVDAVDAAALDAVASWEYLPAIRDGRFADDEIEEILAFQTAAP